MDTRYNSLSASAKMSADSAAEWFINLSRDLAAATGRTLTEEQLWILRHPLWEFSEEIRDDVVHTHNICVDILRESILGQVSRGEPSIQVRPGLWVPQRFQAQYEVIFSTEQPWFISAIVQNVFHGNPFTGEEQAWTPVNDPQEAKHNQHDVQVEDASSKSSKLPVDGKKPINWGLNILAAVAVFALMAFLLFGWPSTTSENEYAATTYEYDEIQPSESVDLGESPPGDYFDLGEFAFQWVSSFECNPETACTEARIFSKFQCEYEVWIWWQQSDESGFSAPDTKETVIPPMWRGQTVKVRLESQLESINVYTQHEINRITCGQTG